MTEPIRVLHVDDEPDFGELTAEYLELEDDRFDVTTETRPSDALKRVSEEEIDCIVSDYEMPDMDGLTLLERVRAEARDVPFILFTGKGSEEIASRAISAGVTDYLQKDSGTSQYQVLANRLVNAVEKYRAERSLRRREDRLEALLDYSSDAITVLDENGAVTYCSPSVERHFGYDPERLLDDGLDEFVHPDERDRLAGAVREAGAGSGLIDSIEFRFRHADGSWRWVEAVVNSQLDDPLVEGVILNWRDVTEQKAYERELEETNELLGAVIDASPAAILSYDLDGMVQLWNPAAEEIYGWTAEESLGEPLPMVPEEKEHELEEIYERVFGGESITNLELRRETKSGEMIDISLSTAPVRDEDGEVIGNVSVAQDVTERKDREEELGEIRRRMELALSGTDSIIWERDVEADSFTRHGPVEDVYGDTEEGVGETIEDFYRMVHPDDRSSVRQAMERTVRTGEEYDTEYRIERDGGARWFRTQASVRTDEKGRTAQVVGLATDITELKRRERELQRYETIIEALGDPVYALDADGHYTIVNDAYVENTGCSREEVLGTHISDIVPEEDLETGREHVRELLRDDDRRTTTWEASRLTADGERIPWEHHMALLPFDENGNFRGTAGVIRDISDRREREERLEETTDRMQLALRGANSWIWDWNLDTDVTTQSAVTGILGVDEETVTRPIGEFIDQLHPDDRELFRSRKKQAVEGDSVYHAEYRLIEGDEVRWIESRGQVHRGGPGGDDRMIGIATDVTERKERALERQWMMRALDQSSEAVFVSDPETARIKYANDTACEQLRYERGELLTRTILDIQPNISTDSEWREHIERLRSEGHRLFEGTHVRSDGTRIPVEVNTGLVEIDRQEYLLGIARDITHRKERERELQRQIDRLDEFASIVSHDLRNPLNVAMGRLQTVKRETDDEHLDAIDRALHRMQTLIDDLLTLAREGGPAVDVRPVGLDDLTEACWQTVETGDATLDVDTSMTIEADPDRLRQLLENLIRNAVEHSDGEVGVTVGSIDDGSGFYVEDDGPGIPEGDREQVFETGYSTTDGGTGFGLAIVKKIAESHGWEVTAAGGSAGDGARFEIGGVRTGG